jgi:hypothetical protein
MVISFYSVFRSPLRCCSYGWSPLLVVSATRGDNFSRIFPPLMQSPGAGFGVGAGIPGAARSVAVRERGGSGMLRRVLRLQASEAPGWGVLTEKNYQ